MSFRHDFVWGAAAASYQIEGATRADGRGACVWDMFSAQPGKIWEKQDATVACDHYYRFPEDIALMKEIGLKAYRLSVSWPRILPQGTGPSNQAGLDFYDRLIDALLAAGIEPWVTLFHWDFPHALYLRGGWLNPDSPRWFQDYVRLVVDKLSDRVAHWFTFNEPQCFIGIGLREGRHAPGDRLGWSEVLRANHHTLLAHGLAVQTIRAYARRKPVIGIAPVAGARVPATEKPEDIAAASRAMFTAEQPDVWDIALWSDPALLGRYPEHAKPVYGADFPDFPADDLKTICQPLDFYGFNIYNGRRVRAGVQGAPVIVSDGVGNPRTSFQWSIVPESIYWASRFFQERYRLPIIISENGLANPDWRSLDGRVHDTQRCDYLVRHLAELRRATRDGVDVRGYFHWSVMDNFEWAEGYKHRFGLIHVDYATQQRTLKDSAFLYRDIINANGANLPPSGRF